MKAAYKWRLQNGIYGYITDETGNKGPFIYYISDSTREYENGSTEVAEPNEGQIASVVSKMTKQQYTNAFNRFKEFVLAKYPDISFLDVIYYYNIENDECSASASSLKCAATDILFDVATVRTGTTADVTIEAVNSDTTNGEPLQYNMSFVIPVEGGGGCCPYEPSDTSLKTIELGGIGKDTTALSLNGKTFSELFDMLLFPTYIGKYTKGSNPSLNGGGGTYYIYSSAPTIALNNNGTTSKIEAGAYTVTQTGPDVPNNVPQFKPSDMKGAHYGGISTDYYNITWDKSAEKIKDTKGNDCIYASSATTTYLRSDAERATGTELSNLTAYSDGGYLKREVRSTRATIYVVYPYWYKKSSHGSASTDISGGASSGSPINTVPTYFEKVDATTASEFIFTGPSESPTDMTSFLLPASFGGVKMIMKDSTGFNEDTNTQATSTKTVWIKLSGWDSAIQYTLYTKSTTYGGAAEYKIKYNIA